MNRYFILLLTLLLMTCEKPERIWSNPNDTDSDKSLWAPTELQIEQITVTQIELTWNDNADGEDGFKIDRKIDDGDWEIEYKVVIENMELLLDTIDTHDIPYGYRLYAYTNENNSNLVEGSITPTMINPQSPILTVNSNLSNESIDLEWTEIIDEEFAFYKLYRSIDDIITFNDNLVFQTYEKSDTSFSDTGVQEGIYYYYALFTFLTDNIYFTSNTVNSIMKQNPESVILEIINTDEDSVSLTWTQSNDILFSHYAIYRDTSPGVTTNSQQIYTTYSNSELSYVDNSINGGETYYYSIAVFDQLSNYSLSNEEQVEVPLITRYFVPSEYPTISDAIDYADAGDSVIVEEGTYYESVFINKDITFGSLFLIDNDESHIDNTILSGAGVNIPITTLSGCNIVGLTITQGSNYGLVIDENCQGDININNSIISNCTKNGIRCDDNPNGINLTINNTNIRNNNDGCIDLYSFNGVLNINNSIMNGNENGIIYTTGNLNIYDTEIYNNGDAGGVLLSGSNCIINNTTIFNNTGFLNCEYLQIDNSLLYDNTNFYIGIDNGGTINNSEIHKNEGTQIIACNTSGGFSVSNSKIYSNTTIPYDQWDHWYHSFQKLNFYNCLIYNNSGFYGTSYCYIENSVISNNNFSNSLFYWTDIGLVNSIVWDNTGGFGNPSAIYTNSDNAIDGVGNISQDPEFSDELFHLEITSPCIDAGNPLSEFNDPDGSRNDMGAYGGPNGDW